jgi:hypothetical protein
MRVIPSRSAAQCHEKARDTHIQFQQILFSWLSQWRFVGAWTRLSTCKSGNRLSTFIIVRARWMLSKIIFRRALIVGADLISRPCQGLIMA